MTALIRLKPFEGHNNISMIESAYKRVTELYNVRITAKTYLEKYKEFIESDYAPVH